MSAEAIQILEQAEPPPLDSGDRLSRTVFHRRYAGNGVQEYLAVQVYERTIDWFVLRQGVYESLPASDEGVLKSEVFPGLWLQPAAFWAGELAMLLTVLQQGLATPEHSAFAEKLRPAAPGAQSAEQA